MDQEIKIGFTEKYPGCPVIDPLQMIMDKLDLIENKLIVLQSIFSSNEEKNMKEKKWTSCKKSLPFELQEVQVEKISGEFLDGVYLKFGKWKWPSGLHAENLDSSDVWRLK